MVRLVVDHAHHGHIGHSRRNHGYPADMQKVAFELQLGLMADIVCQELLPRLELEQRQRQRLHREFEPQA